MEDSFETEVHDGPLQVGLLYINYNPNQPLVRQFIGFFLSYGKLVFEAHFVEDVFFLCFEVDYLFPEKGLSLRNSRLRGRWGVACPFMCAIGSIESHGLPMVGIDSSIV